MWLGLRKKSNEPEKKEIKPNDERKGERNKK